MVAPLLQRVVPAAAVALAVALLGFGAIGVATADDGQAAAVEDGPSWFQIAPRHAGDLESMSWRVEALDESGTVTQQLFSMTTHAQWGEEQLFMGRNGAWTAAHPRYVAPVTSQFQGSDQVEVDGSFSVQQVDWVRTSDHAVLGRGVHSGSNITYDFGTYSLLYGRPSSSTSFDATFWTDEGPCGLDAAVRAGIDLGEDLTVVDTCLHYTPDPASKPPTTFTVGVGEVGGVATVRFTGADGDDLVRVDYHESVPRALQVEVLIGGAAGPATGRSVTTLTAFEAGTGAWDTGLEVPPPASLPPIELAPRQPWGPDDAGVEHPFPASQAWRMALEEPAFTDFRAYLEKHPDAVARSGDFQQSRNGNSTSYQWSWTVQDASSMRSVQSTMTVAPPGAMATDLLGLGPAPLPQQTSYSYSVSDVGFRDCEHGFERVDDAAPGFAMPTAASVLARWQAMAGPDRQGNAWEFECGSVTAGLQSTVAPPMRATSVAGDRDLLDYSFEGLQVDPTGAPVALLELSVGVGSDSALPVASSPPASADSPASREVAQGRPLQVAVAGVVWAAPSTPAASGAAAVSLLAGLLYWLWPALKGAPLGLFSRIEAPRLLDHPVRRSLVDAVEANPGIHYQALLRIVGGGKGATEHHLRKLVAARLLMRHQGPGYTCFFPPRTDHRVAATAGALKSDSARRLLAEVRRRPGISSVDLAAATGLDASTVSHHVHRLAQAGLLEPTRVGRALSLRATGLAGASGAA